MVMLQAVELLEMLYLLYTDEIIAVTWFIQFIDCENAILNFIFWLW